MPRQPDQVVGDRYRVLEVLKTRAQTATYLAVDSRAGNSKVVLRELPIPDLGPSRNDLQVLFAWFEEERKLLGRVQHPSMARLRDFHFLDGWLYLVTEYVEGQTLEAELAQTLKETGQPLPAEELVYQILDVLELLDNLHSLQPPMLHRDIKPANLVRETGTGSIRLVGIGLARPGETATAQAAGGYSPLEQIHGHAEPRSDIYALGATLSQLLTGEPPIPLGIPPVLDLNPNVEPELAALVDRACAFTPEKRFQSAREMGEALNDWLERLGTFLPTNLNLADLVSPEPVVDELAPWGKLPPLGPAPEPTPAAPAPAPIAPVPRRFEPAPPAQWKPRPRPPVFPKQAETLRHQVVPPRPTAPSRTVTNAGSWQALESRAVRDPARPAPPGTFQGEFAWLAEPSAAPVQQPAAAQPPAVDEDEGSWTGGVPQTEDEDAPRASAARPEEGPKAAWSPGSERGAGGPSSGTPRPPVPPAGERTLPPRPAGKPGVQSAPPPPRTEPPRPGSARPAVAAPLEPTPGKSSVLTWLLLLLALVAVMVGGYFAGRHFRGPAATPPAPAEQTSVSRLST